MATAASVLLDAINATIIKVGSGQAGTWDGKSVTMANLSELMAARRELKIEVDGENNVSRMRVNQGIIKRD